MDEFRSKGSALSTRRRGGSASNLTGAVLLLKLASHPGRLQILLSLYEKEHDTRQLCQSLGGQALSAVSQHLTELRRGALVKPRRQGTEKVHALTESGFRLVQAIRRISALSNMFPTSPLEPVESPVIQPTLIT